MFNGAIFNHAIFNDCAEVAPSDDVGGGGKALRGSKPRPWEQKWRQELVELLLEDELKPVEVPRRVRRAIQRVREAAPVDDSGARRALRGELDQLKVSYRPVFLDALRYEIAKHYQEQMRREEMAWALREQDDEEVLLLLH